MQLHSKLRSIPLVLTKAGQVPTIPKPHNLAVDANGWNNTDLADGEYAINNKDNLFFWRSGLNIFTLDITYINNIIANLIIQINNIISNLHEGNRYIIPAGVNIVVKDNYQYLIKDNLYLTGGSITLEGNAQLCIL